jgi:hypothetical protein
MKRMRVTLEIPDWYPDNDDARTVLDALLTAEGEYDSVASVVEVEWLDDLQPLVVDLYETAIELAVDALGGDDNEG